MRMMLYSSMIAAALLGGTACKKSANEKAADTRSRMPAGFCAATAAAASATTNSKALEKATLLDVDAFGSIIL